MLLKRGMVTIYNFRYQQKTYLNISTFYILLLFHGFIYILEMVFLKNVFKIYLGKISFPRSISFLIN